MIKIPPDFIEKNFSPADFLANCHEAFVMYANGSAVMPPREENVDERGKFTLKMPAQIPGYSGYKFIEELPSDQPGKLGQRTAIIRLSPDNDAASNAVEVGLDAEYITNMRTGAAGVLGMKYFAPQAKNIAVLGTGKIAKALALCAIEFGVKTINVFSRKPENREKFKQDIIEHSVFNNIVLCDSIPACISGVEAILTAVPTLEPILFLKDLPSRVYISVMGGDSRTAQLDGEILKRGVVVPDNLEQCRKSGEFKLALEQGNYNEINFAQINGRVANIGDAAIGGLKLDSGIVISYFTGLAVQDINAAKMVYEKFIKTA
ncbi:MAG: ornithine cyclodeaminase family protein [Parcubacteria group bacterium]|nr:ornithine cyclodeaminase family protein [Parcubacteria group bacterium]